MPLCDPILKNCFIWEVETLKKNNIGRTRILRWVGRENEENVARTRNCCGGPSSPRHTLHGQIEVSSIDPKF